jgi:hypothetical protein
MTLQPAVSYTFNYYIYTPWTSVTSSIWRLSRYIWRPIESNIISHWCSDQHGPPQNYYPQSCLPEKSCWCLGVFLFWGWWTSHQVKASTLGDGRKIYCTCLFSRWFVLDVIGRNLCVSEYPSGFLLKVRVLQEVSTWVWRESCLPFRREFSKSVPSRDDELLRVYFREMGSPGNSLWNLSIAEIVMRVSETILWVWYISTCRPLYMTHISKEQTKTNSNNSVRWRFEIFFLYPVSEDQVKSENTAGNGQPGSVETAQLPSSREGPSGKRRRRRSSHPSWL